MTHFSAGEWTDYIRDLVGPTSGAEMDRHLNEDRCEECRAEVQFLLDVASWAEAERELSVPAELSAMAKAVFVHTPPRQTLRDWIGRLDRVVAELVSAGPQDWAPVGVRSGGLGAQRLLYRAGDVTVDLALDALASMPNVEITGQVMSGAVSLDSLNSVPVQVVSGGRILAETETNQFGEFMLTTPERSSMTLQLAFRERHQRVEIAIRGGIR